MYAVNQDDLDANKSIETSGASLYEALERYKKYERKLKDTVKPNEEILRRFIQTPNLHQTLNQSIKSNSNMFPHGG